MRHATITSAHLLLGIHRESRGRQKGLLTTTWCGGSGTQPPLPDKPDISVHPITRSIPSQPAAGQRLLDVFVPAHQITGFRSGSIAEPRNSFRKQPAGQR